MRGRRKGRARCFKQKQTAVFSIALPATHTPATQHPPAPPPQIPAVLALLAAAGVSAQDAAAPAADPSSVSFKLAQSLPFAAGQGKAPPADAVDAIAKSIAAAAGVGGAAVKVTPGPSALAPNPSKKARGTGATTADGLPCLPRSTCYSFAVDAALGDEAAASAFKQRLARGSVADLLPAGAGSSGVTVGKVRGAPAQARVVVLDESAAGLGGAKPAAATAAGAGAGRERLSKGALAGVIVGSILGGLLLLGLLGLLCTRCRRGNGRGARAATQVSTGAKAASAAVGTGAAAVAGGAGTAAVKTESAATAAGATAAEAVDKTAAAVNKGSTSGRFGRSASKGTDGSEVV